MPPKNPAARYAQTPNKAVSTAKSADLPPASKTQATAWKTYVPAWMIQATAWKTYANPWNTHAVTWKTNATAWTTYVPAWKTATALALLVASTAHAQSQLIILEPEAGFQTTEGLDLNDAGEVLVHRRRATGSTEPVSEWSAIWENGVWRPLAYPAPVQSVCVQNTSYPVQIGNWNALVGSSINSAGTVAGVFTNGCSTNFPATWTRDGVVTRYRRANEPSCVVPYAFWMYAAEIGDGGVVSGGPRNCGINIGSYLSLGTTQVFGNVLSPGLIYTSVRDINASGVAVGSADGGSGNPRALRWASPSSFIDLGPGTAIAISDAGDILLANGIWRDGVVTPLNPAGTPAALRLTSVVDMNDIGSVLDSSVVLVRGERYPLADLGMAAPGYQNWSPKRINNLNWITGTVWLADGTNRQRAFVLKIVLPCDAVDFNQNGVFPEDQDVVDFFDVLAGGSCPACNDIDFNNNGVFPEDQDVIDFFNVLAGGTCP